MLPAQTASASSGRKLMTIAQLIVSLLGIVASLVSAGLLVIIGLIGLASESTTPGDVTTVFSSAWISLLVAALSTPSLIYSAQALRERPFSLPRVNGFRLSTILLLAWPLVLLLGNLVSQAGSVSWLLLPPLGLLAVGLPIWWLVEFARRRILPGSQQRQWGIVSFGMLVTTPVLLFVEVLLLLVVVVLFSVWISTQPELLRALDQLVERLTFGQPDPEAILSLIRPYLSDPLVIFGILAMVAGVVPLIEELLKPLAVWMLAGSALTPGQGFVAGALSGGVFALLESLFYISSPLGSGWLALATGRAVTGLLHITTTALVGWALASAWRNGSYLRLGAAYLLASALHGLWNGLSILTGLSAIQAGSAGEPAWLTSLSRVGPVALALLAGVFFMVLWWSNRSIRRQEQEAGKGLPEQSLPAKSS